jgi:hypothetical protein
MTDKEDRSDPGGAAQLKAELDAGEEILRTATLARLRAEK